MLSKISGHKPVVLGYQTDPHPKLSFLRCETMTALLQVRGGEENIRERMDDCVTVIFASLITTCIFASHIL